MVELLAEYGTQLRFPYSSGVAGSRHGHMRELRLQSSGRPVRVFYAFDPRRSAILPIGGDKTGDDRFYEQFVPLTDRLYYEHLKELRDERLIERSALLFSFPRLALSNTCRLAPTSELPHMS